MATDALTTITNIINSPPGQLVAGGVWQAIAVQFGVGLGLFYGVMKIFDAVGDRLNEKTKGEIAVWLLGRKRVGPKVQPWPDTFAKVFDRVFGSRHISVRCFALSAFISFAAGIFLTIYAPSPYRTLPLAFQVREAFTQSAVTLLCGKVVKPPVDSISGSSGSTGTSILRRSPSNQSGWCPGCCLRWCIGRR